MNSNLFGRRLKFAAMSFAVFDRLASILERQGRETQEELKIVSSIARVAEQVRGKNSGRAANA